VSQGAALDGARVLITGGLGFIGSNLARRCVELGARVTIYDSLDPRGGGNVHNADEIRDAVTLVQADIRRPDDLAAALQSQQLVFHCAAFTSHAGSMQEPFEDLDVNCRGTLTLLEAVRRFNPEARVVSIGTSTQIGRMRSSPVDEWHPEFPLDLYSAHRSLAEKYVLIYGEAHRLATCVIRFANVYGPRAHVRSSRFGFMNFFIGLALQDREVTVFGEGLQMRNVLFVDDCVEALVIAASRPEALGQVFFATGDEQYSVATIASRIVAVVGRGRVRHVPWPADKAAIEVGDAVISNRRIKDALGWQPKSELDAGLAATRDYFQPRMNVYLE
jgi:UDP-glucose 4-epimerase